MYIFLDEHQKILKLLVKHDVEFMLIGGYAVIIYGYERGTGDMDIWLKPDNENKIKFIAALREHCISEDNLKEVEKMNFNEARVLHIGKKPNKVDFLTRVQGLTFDEADKGKTYITLNNQAIPVINYQHLIVLKMIAGRPQDKADVDILQKINKFRNKK